MKVKVMWSLRGRTVVEIPDDMEVDSFDHHMEETIRAEMENSTTEMWQWDSDGYEIDDWRVIT